MKLLCCLGLFFVVMDAFSEDAESEKSDPTEPTEVKAPDDTDDDSGKPKVYADISDSAQKNAASFDGVRGVIGFNFSKNKFGASARQAHQQGSSLSENFNYTENSIDLFGLCFGVEYSKSFRSNFLVAGDVGIDLTKKEAKEGAWSDLNKDYDERLPTYTPPKTGKLEKKAITLRGGIKCGYMIPSYKSMVFLKLGVSKVDGRYYYNHDTASGADVQFSVYVPSVAIGVEKKFNKQWGASLEASISMKRSNNYTASDTSEHSVRVGRNDVRLMGIFNILK